MSRRVRTAAAACRLTMDWLTTTASRLLEQLVAVLRYPIVPEQRLFYLYVLSSLGFALVLYLRSEQRDDDVAQGTGLMRGLARFVFPPAVWSHSSAWVDVRYFVPHQMLRLWIYSQVVVAAAVGGNLAVTGFFQSAFGEPGLVPATQGSLPMIAAYTLASVVALDFSAFLMHLCQHKFPLLWAFHKVHHSAEVLHPLSNYREHPVDNVCYALVTGSSLGMVNAGFAFVFNVTPQALVTPLLGIGLAGFLYNILGYHLRHSHLWLRWPGVWVYVFGCPAHHQIHHSCEPQHIDRNFAFVLPVWDVIFGTFYMPSDRDPLTFGLGDGSEPKYKSLWSLYTLPFIDLAKRVRLWH
ncbi:MAG: sterol desaturase family protein [Gammaproteobacteria bacterium]